MFLNSLNSVRDSQFTHLFVGTDDVLEEHGLGNVVGGGDGGGGDDEDGGRGSNRVTTVWCGVMNFYRVALFSYRATSDDTVLLNGDNEKTGRESFYYGFILKMYPFNSKRHNVLSPCQPTTSNSQRKQHHHF